MAENEGTGASQEASTTENQEGEKSRSQESVLAEMNRKYNKISEENSKMSQMLEQLIAKQNAPAAAAQVSQESNEKELADLVYSNPAEYARRVIASAKKEAGQVVNYTINQQQQTNNVLTKLATEYPELSDNNSELTTKAVEMYKNMSNEERQSASAYKIAVRDAAADLGILPKAKRPKDSSYEPNIGTSNSAANEVAKGQQREQTKSVKASAKSLELAALMGLDTSKKEVREGLDKRANEIANRRKGSN